MSRSRGKRYDYAPRKLNMKKVIATIIVFVVIIMMILSFKKLLTTEPNSKEFSSLTTYISVLENNKWGIIDNKGNKVIDLQYDEMIAIPDKNKPIFICTYDIDYNNETYKTKVINEEGKEIFTQYENVEPIENTDGSNLWYESNILKFKKNGKFGLINFEGKTIVEPVYDNIYAMQGIQKSIIIEKEGRKGLVNGNTGEIIINPEYIDITALSDTYENGYIVKNPENKCGLIAVDTTKILDVKYDEIKRVTGNKYYVVSENGTLEVVDSTGNVILNKGFESVEDIQVDNFIITVGGKYGVIDKSGNTIIAPEYENLKFGETDTFIAQRNGKYGIIKIDSSVLVDFAYEKIIYIKTADFFEAEKADFTTDIIDRNFNVILSQVIISELNIDDGYLRVRKDNEYKYYNFKFEEKTNKDVLTTNTLFLVKENGKYGYENKNGDKIVDCIYDDAKEQNEFGYCAVKKDGVWGALKSDGTVVVKPSRNLDDYLYIDFISEWNRYDDLKLNVYTK